MTSRVFMPFLTYIPTYLVHSLTPHLGGYLGTPPPLPTIKSDIINGRSLRQCVLKTTKIKNNYVGSCFSLAILSLTSHIQFVNCMKFTYKQDFILFSYIFGLVRLWIPVYFFVISAKVKIICILIIS